MEVCASLPDTGHAIAAPLLDQAAEHASVTKSYARISEVPMNGGAGVAVLVCVGSAEGVGVLVGASMTVTCTQISPVEFVPRPKCLPLLSSNDQIPL